MSKEHTYTNGEVTIVWRKERCIHSTKCWKGLPGVFQPGQRPWIQPDGATTEQILAQVEQCPSGALSIRRDPSEATAASIVRIHVTAKGPLVVKGPVEVDHGDGRVEREEGTCALCRCGASQNKPWCDGSHRRIGFTG